MSATQLQCQIMVKSISGSVEVTLQRINTFVPDCHKFRIEVQEVDAQVAEKRGAIVLKNKQTYCD